MSLQKGRGWTGFAGALTLLFFLTTGFPLLRLSLLTNRAALHALAVCEGQAPLAVMDGQPAFFRAGAAACMGLDAEAQAAYRAALSDPAARLDVIRAVHPLDAGLAALAAQAHPDQAQAHFWLAAALTAAGNTAASIPAYEAGLHLDPANGEEWENLGRLYDAAGNWELAVQAFDQACLYVDQGKNGCPNAARLYFAHGKYALAEQRWRDALEQLPGWEPAWRGLADALLAQGRDAEAQEILEGLATP